MSALTRRHAIGRLALMAAGTVAAFAFPEPVGASPVAPAPDPDVYHGPLWTVTSDEMGAAVKSERIAAIVLYLSDQAVPGRLWVNLDLVGPEQGAAVEQWARRQVGAGTLFDLLDVGELATI